MSEFYATDQHGKRVPSAAPKASGPVPRVQGQMPDPMILQVIYPTEAPVEAAIRHLTWATLANSFSIFLLLIGFVVLALVK